MMMKRHPDKEVFCLGSVVDDEAAAADDDRSLIWSGG